jgi:hypothetical protein
MVLLKRMALAFVLSCFSEGAIAQQSAPATPNSSHIETCGIHISEGIDTRELAKDGAREFLFVLGAPRIQGTVQMVINPVAIG